MPSWSRPEQGAFRLEHRRTLHRITNSTAFWVANQVLIQTDSIPDRERPADRAVITRTLATVGAPGQWRLGGTRKGIRLRACANGNFRLVPKADPLQASDRDSDPAEPGVGAGAYLAGKPQWPQG